jgi:hypothetical protein
MRLMMPEQEEDQHEHNTSNKPNSSLSRPHSFVSKREYQKYSFKNQQNALLMLKNQLGIQLSDLEYFIQHDQDYLQPRDQPICRMCNLYEGPWCGVD